MFCIRKQRDGHRRGPVGAFVRDEKRLSLLAG